MGVYEERVSLLQKAWQAFAENGADIDEEVDAKKQTLDQDGASELLKTAEKVVVASGKKMLEFDPAGDNFDELLKKATGRTGNLRAPTVRIGSVLYVGFNQEMYDQLVS